MHMASRFLPEDPGLADVLDDMFSCQSFFVHDLTSRLGLQSTVPSLVTDRDELEAVELAAPPRPDDPDSVTKPESDLLPPQTIAPPHVDDPDSVTEPESDPLPQATAPPCPDDLDSVTEPESDPPLQVVTAPLHMDNLDSITKPKSDPSKPTITITSTPKTTITKRKSIFTTPSPPPPGSIYWKSTVAKSRKPGYSPHPSGSPRKKTASQKSSEASTTPHDPLAFPYAAVPPRARPQAEDRDEEIPEAPPLRPRTPEPEPEPSDDYSEPESDSDDDMPKLIERKICQPPDFHGNRENTQKFLHLVTLYLDINAEIYSDDMKKIAFALPFTK
ncbi:hypothetical protein BDR05DRAFT_945659 [Suillus weaverae]|nr:hypothetical protein BDR05DRAFT_945659 [Suillus weaverae]